ncbi:hypothetical protein M0R36_10630 [bacterium]|jgi:hypothetical protein|nr:hypothetical protein [bacterium]
MNKEVKPLIEELIHILNNLESMEVKIRCRDSNDFSHVIPYWHTSDFHGGRVRNMIKWDTEKKTWRSGENE